MSRNFEEMDRDAYDEMTGDIRRGRVRIHPARLKAYEKDIRRQFWMDRFREGLLLCIGAGIAETVRAGMFIWIVMHTVTK